MSTADGVALDVLCRLSGLPIPVPEYLFAAHVRRKWAFDWAWVPQRVAVEIEGGAWSRGRHTRGAGFVADMTKYNEAAIDGWLLLRMTPSQVPTVAGLDLIRRALAVRRRGTT